MQACHSRKSGYADQGDGLLANDQSLSRCGYRAIFQMPSRKPTEGNDDEGAIYCADVASDNPGNRLASPKQWASTRPKIGGEGGIIDGLVQAGAKR